MVTVLGEYGRDELNNNGKRLLTFAKDNKRALTNTFFSTRKGGVSHTFNGISSRNDQKRIDFILTRQAHRPRVYDVKVHAQPPPPAKADSDHNIVLRSIRVGPPQRSFCTQQTRANDKTNPAVRSAEV